MGEMVLDVVKGAAKALAGKFFCQQVGNCVTPLPVPETIEHQAEEEMTPRRLHPQAPVAGDLGQLLARWVVAIDGAQYTLHVTKLVPQITTGELRSAQIGTLREWWLPQLEFPGRFLDRAYQAYAVLTMCRALCLLTLGKVVTKPDAAAWALRGAYLEPWRTLIRSAVAYPGGRQTDQRGATIDFIRFALEEAGIGHDAPSS